MKGCKAWYYDEMKQIGTDYANIDEVASYDRQMEKLRDIKKEIEEVKSAVRPNKNELILEIGTGTGELAIEISRYCRKVFALDISRTMLRYAKKKATMQKRDNIEFFHAGFLTYEHKGRPVDIVLSQIALHHLPDFWKMIALRRIFRILKKGGRFYLRDVIFPSHIDDYGSFFKEVLGGIKKSGGSTMLKQTENHIKYEYSTLDWIMENLLKKTGFSIKKKDHKNGFIATYLCVK